MALCTEISPVPPLAIGTSVRKTRTPSPWAVAPSSVAMGRSVRFWTVALNVKLESAAVYATPDDASRTYHP